MISLATTTVSLYRGTSIDDYGDEIDSATSVGSRIPCSLLEQRRWVETQDADQPMVVRYYTARLPHGTDVQVGDRLDDERTGKVYMVDSSTQVQSPMIATDIRLDLRLVS